MKNIEGNPRLVLVGKGGTLQRIQLDKGGVYDLKDSVLPKEKATRDAMLTHALTILKQKDPQWRSSFKTRQKHLGVLDGIKPGSYVYTPLLRSPIGKEGSFKGAFILPLSGCVSNGHRRLLRLP